MIKSFIKLLKDIQLYRYMYYPQILLEWDKYPIFCRAYYATMTNITVFNKYPHLKLRKTEKTLQAEQEKKRELKREYGKTLVTCEVCNKEVLRHSFSKHKQTKQHQKNMFIHK